MGSGTHYSKIDGFPGIHGTHANGATDLVLPQATIPQVNCLKSVFENEQLNIEKLSRGLAKCFFKFVFER